MPLEVKPITELETGSYFKDPSSGKHYKIKNFATGMVEVKEQKTGKLFVWPNRVNVIPMSFVGS